MKNIPRPTVSQLPKPSELRLTDGKQNLQQMKQQKVRLYQWRALFGVAALVLCACAGYLLFQDAVNIIDWFKGFGIWSPVLFTIALSLAMFFSCQLRLSKLVQELFFRFGLQWL